MDNPDITGCGGGSGEVNGGSTRITGGVFAVNVALSSSRVGVFLLSVLSGVGGCLYS